MISIQADIQVYKTIMKFKYYNKSFHPIRCEYIKTIINTWETMMKIRYKKIQNLIIQMIFQF